MKTMKRTFVTALLTAASLIAPAGAFAQRRVQATIPFDFTVADRLMPAGNYVITHVSSSVVLVRAWKGKDLVSAATLTSPANNERKNANRLIFNKYGDQYFLSEIHEGLGEGAGRVNTSRLEERVRLQQAAIANKAKTEIALK
jgi:hypothetical protein